MVKNAQKTFCDMGTKNVIFLADFRKVTVNGEKLPKLIKNGQKRHFAIWVSKS